MHHTGVRYLKWATAACTGALVVALLAPPALADPPQFDTFPTVGDFTPVTLNGTQQLSTATITPFIIDDSSGTLNGWNVTLTIPDLQNGTGQDCSTGATATLPGAGVTMDAPVVTPADGDTSMTGVSAAGFTDFTSPRIIIDAAAGDGAGTYDVSPELVQLTVPSDTTTGTYCTLATIAIASGP
jgi:hypothetical protein